VHRRLYDIDMKAVMATEALQETLGAIGRAARKRGDVLLFIDDWERYVRRGTTVDGLDTEQAIRILIARGLIQLVGAVTDPAVAQEISENRPIGFRTFPVRVEAVEGR